GEHFDHAADLFALAARGVLYGGALGEHARVHAHERQGAVRIVDYLEREAAERLVIRALTLADDVAIFVQRLDGRDIRGRRHVVDNGIQHLLHALVLVRRAAQHRVERTRHRAFTQTPTEHVR